MQSQNIKSEKSPEISKKSLLQIPYFVLTISLVVTISVTYFFYSSAKTIDAERFIAQTNTIKAEIESRLNTYIALLRAGRGYFNASGEVSKDEFADFVKNLNLRTFYPGVLAMAYSKVFTAEEKDDLIRKMRSEVSPDFKIFPDSPDSSEGQAIIYIEPYDERNKIALGYDMSKESVRKLALDTARDSGMFATSGKVVLVQETEAGVQGGFLIYVPVYKNSDIPETIEERRKQIDGFVYSPFRAGEFVKDVVNQGKIDDIIFKIYDGNLSENSILATGNPDQIVNSFPLQAQNEIDVGNRKWIITYSTTAKFQSQSLIWWTPIIFFLGLAISIILFFLSLSQSRTNLDLIKTANDLTASATMVQILLESEKEARQEAEKSAKVKDEFLATVSHELRTPLNVIGGWINILKLSNVEAETKRKAIETINKSLRSQTNLVEQMLIFSDKEFLINSENWQRFSFSELINECLVEVEGRVSEKNLELIKNITETTEIFGDKKKLKQGIICLLDNAIKFSSSGGRITIDLQEIKDQILLKIGDTGEGISEEVLPHIFESFRQSDSSTIRKHSGLGLGLAIAKKIVEGHGGTITVESSGLQKGATFIVNLPLAKGA